MTLGILIIHKIYLSGKFVCFVKTPIMSIGHKSRSKGSGFDMLLELHIILHRININAKLHLPQSEDFKKLNIYQ